MPVYVKSGSYTLLEPFVAGGGVYSKEEASGLSMWIRFRAAPVDESGSGLTVSYNNTPVFSNQLVPSREVNRIGELPVAEFSSTDNTSSKVNANALFKFNDGSSDTPFTFSVWAKTAEPWDGAHHYFYSQDNAAGSNESIRWGPESSRGMVLQLRNAAFNTYVARSNPRLAGAVIKNSALPNQWVHYAVTYDGSASERGVKMYLNGEYIGGTATAAAGYVFNDTNATADPFIGARSLSGPAAEEDAEFSEFCMWRRALSSSAIKALYHSTAGRYYAKSGVISRPNRVRIRDEDNRQGSYPRQLRTTGKSLERGNDPVKFDDAKIQIFREFDDARFPLVTNDASLENLDLGNIIASPNQNSNLISTGTAAGLLTTQGTYVLDNEPPVSITPFDESAIFLKDESDDFYGVGVSSNDYPGYSSPLKDKVIIKVPISSKEEKILSRYTAHRVAGDSKDGLFGSDAATTGFYYFNFNQSRWEDIGLHPNYAMYYSGSDSNPFSCVSLGSEIIDTQTRNFGTAAGVGRAPKPQQFKMSDHTGNFLDSAFDTNRRTASDPYSELSSSLGYHLIGAPTQAGLAPWHRKYHATGSQTISISDYITGDFLLEKAVIHIPVIVQRMRGHALNPQLDATRYSGTCRDIDNYVFFLYRQRRATTKGSTIDLEYEKDMSRRDLVCSGSATFFNSSAFSGRVPEEIRSRGLPHTPAFSYDFEISPEVVSPHSELVSSFTGSIRIEMKVASPTGQAVGGSRFPLAGNALDDGTAVTPVNSSLTHIRSVVTQDWWTRDREIFSSSLAVNSQLNTLQCHPEPFGSFSNYLAGLAPFVASQKVSATARSIETLGNDRLLRDPRGLKNAFGVGKYYFVDYQSRNDRSQGRIETFGVNQDRDLGFYGYTAENNKSNTNMPILFGSYPSSTTSPFVFEPGDEIVLGVDAGISMLPAGFDITMIGGATVNTADELGHYVPTTPPTFGCMSGSFMKILPEGASLTLFGSQIKRDRQALVSSNQMLTTDAVHESIGDAQVLDQFDVSSRLDLSGSYVDRLMFGSVMPTEESINETNQVTIREIGLNAINTNIHGSGIFKINRSTVSFFSRNWTGVDPTIARTPYHDHWSTIYHDKSTGYPPRFASQPDHDSSIYQWFITNTALTREKDPYYVTPRKANVLSTTNIVSLQRFINIPDSTRTYYDSMAPDILDFANRASDRVPEPTIRPTSDYRKGDDPVVRIWAGNMHKLSEYPYQGDPVRHKDQRFVAHIIPNTGPYASVSPTATEGSLVTTSYANKLIKSTLFNRGFRYESNVSGGFVYPLLTGSHGPSYGMISPVIASPTARFRRDRYGQFRDMLEQRLDTKFYVQGRGGEGFGIVANSPVQIKFVDPADGETRVNPFSTDSQNFSTEYTSSVPYTDGHSSFVPAGRRVVVFTDEMKSALMESTLPTFTVEP